MKIPYHLGIIIDGNRRWALKKGLPTFEGHRRGFENIKKIGERARERGVKILTIYAFSSENWKRSPKEVNYLMGLISRAFSGKYIKDLIRKNIKLNVIGQKEKLSPRLREKIRKAEKLTEPGTGGVLNLAISYGGRAEIVQAVKKILKKRIPVNQIDEEAINRNLWTAGLPYPDFVIRTGGEKRISNFLTWQTAYSELYFIDKYWPDFKEEDLEKAFQDYSRRQRRFGR
jgi:undecaprenyl diphosphate synthase